MANTSGGVAGADLRHTALGSGYLRAMSIVHAKVSEIVAVHYICHAYNHDDDSCQNRDRLHFTATCFTPRLWVNTGQITKRIKMSDWTQ